ncbi:hypothetical protein [Nonomuraea sp. GTA35]|uniref:hypothetical protein n=1 Tax=Nonomuraea sp. GTA35 TaxID=1676746 RepID=UPI0035BF7C1B
MSEGADVPAPVDPSKASEGSSPFHRRSSYGLLVLGALVLILGGCDLFSAEGFGSKSAGAAFLIVGAIAVAGSLRVILRGRPAMRSHLAAAVAVFLAYLSLVCQTAVGFTRHPRLAVVLGFSVLAALFAMWVTWVDGSWLWKNRRSAWIKWPSHELGAAAIGAIVTIVVSIIALSQFWYSVRYLPAQTHPALSVKSEVKVAGVRRDHLTAIATIKVVNTGSPAVRILASMYKIVGVRIIEHVYPRDDAVIDMWRMERATSRNYGPPARYNQAFEETAPELIQAGQVVADFVNLEKGESVETELAIHVPKDKYDVIRVTTDVHYFRADSIDADEDEGDSRGPLAECTMKAGEGDAKVPLTWKYRMSRWPITYDNLMNRLTEDDREAVAVWIMDGASPLPPNPWEPDFPAMKTSIQRVGKSCEHPFREGSDGLEDASMLGRSESMAESVAAVQK